MYDLKQIDAIKNWLGSGSINIFGRPFAGKDNQGKRLVKLFGGTLVGGGEILRDSEISDDIKQNMRIGKLIPSDDYINIVLPFLSQPHLADSPLFLSSIGRWHGEEDSVIKALKKSNHPLKAVIYLNISNADSYNRWLIRETFADRQNRHDDTKEVLEIRFAEFQEKTLPVLDYYRDHDMLIEIDGKRTRDEVTHDILDALSKRINVNHT